MSGKAQVDVPKKHRLQRYGMLPKDVLARTDIGSSEKVLLGVMNMESWSSGIISASDGMLSDLSGISRARIVEMRKGLEIAGLIAKEGKPIKQVQAYRLLHIDMAADAVHSLSTEPQTLRGRREVKLEPCLKCSKACVRSKAEGWCRRCIGDARISRIAKHEIRLDKRASA